MLENITQDLIDKLKNKEGENKERLLIPDVAKGSIIRVITQSGNIYFFEITKPEIGMAHVFCCESRQFAPKSGYRGERKVTKIFELGEQIFHDGSRTSPVKQITLLIL